jgi:hypothetical protein
MASTAADQPRASRENRFLEEVESVSRSIRDPAAKLRYLRASLAQLPQPAAPPPHGVKARVRRLLGARAEAAPLVGALPAAAPRPAARLGRPTSLLAAASVLVALTGVLTTAFQGQLPAAATVAAAPPRAAAGSPARPPVAEALPRLPAGQAPKAIWMVEKGQGYELWSNGLRIDTSFTVEGPARRYRAFERGRGMLDETFDRPVGILFHTTESDIWPLEAGFNENLRDSTQRLLRYLSRERVYHYLVDRFGRVYRVVAEEGKANHAGNSVWAEGERIYLSLNNAFLAVSFETRWEGGRALPITEAQLVSGRNLTDYLRRRFAIEPSMCTAHGLVSVNPAKRLIGHHLDWSRGFPFEAFGLPDQYARTAAAVEDFGFGFDERLVDVLGEPWPGVRAAEAALAEEARRSGRSLAELRRGKQELYDVWQREQVLDEPQARPGGASPRSARASGG